MKLNDAIAAYVKLRDAKAALKKKHDEAAKPITEKMEKLENAILKAFQATGQESAKTSAGTAYKTTKSSATVADRDAFLEFVRAEGAWEFLENRVSKSAVEEYRQAHEALPPGVNYSSVVSLGVRRD